MAKIKGKNTSLETGFRKLLWKEGMKGYRTHYNIHGKPDVVFVSRRIAIFLDGDFWHGYNWKKLGKVPPKKYWQSKLQKNIDRAKKYNRQLKKDGWRVLRFWGHDVRKNPQICIKRIKKLLIPKS